MVKIRCVSQFIDISPHFGPNLHLKNAITIALAFEYSCDVSKIISEAIGVFWRLTATTIPYLKPCGVAKTGCASQFLDIFSTL